MSNTHIYLKLLLKCLLQCNRATKIHVFLFPFQVPPTIEICYVPRTKVASQYPCFVLFTQVARMMRPVTNLSLNKVEMIGTFEQASLNICITPKEAIQGVSVNDMQQCFMPCSRNLSLVISFFFLVMNKNLILEEYNNMLLFAVNNASRDARRQHAQCHCEYDSIF